MADIKIKAKSKDEHGWMFDVEVYKLVEKYGVGGHKSAARFSTENTDFLKFKKRH